MALVGVLEQHVEAGGLAEKRRLREDAVYREPGQVPVSQQHGQNRDGTQQERDQQGHVVVEVQATES